MECKFRKRHIKSNLNVRTRDDSIPQITKFKYFGSIIQNDGEIEKYVNHMIQAEWMKWRSASSVICDKRVRSNSRECFIAQL